MEALPPLILGPQPEGFPALLIGHSVLPMRFRVRGYAAAVGPEHDDVSPADKKPNRGHGSIDAMVIFTRRSNLSMWP